MPEFGPETDTDHAHRWQPAGLIPPAGRQDLVALCPCGAVARLKIPDESADA